MKKVLLLSCALLVIAGTAFAQLPHGYIGLFTDADHDTWCITGSPVYSFDFWIFCYPSVDSMLCAEFAISYPATGVIQSTVTPNTAIISVSLGTLPGGMSVCYLECQLDINWCFHQQVFVTDANPKMIEIIVHPAPEIEHIRFAECNDPTYPVEPVVKFTNLYINYDPITDPLCQETGTESKSWGAIKTLFNE
jgi:hypothetical protein